MGPVGRTFEVQGGASLKGAAAIFAYSKTKGLYAGVSVEGGLVVESSHANMKMYHRNVTAKELLSGEITPPPEVEPLLRVLALDIFHPPKNQRSLDMVSGSRELPAMVENRSQSWVQSQPRLAELNAGAENQPPSEVHSESRLPAELHAESREPEIFELPAESNEVSTTVDPRRESNRDLTRVRRKPTATSSASGSQEETDQTSPDEARGGSEGPSMAVEPLDDSNQVSTAVERREESKGVDSHESNRTSPCCG
ncbi:SH3 domain-containing protein [Aspergillus sclerotialis]|uniref:SH3 domain-containing protein n=1 Tax=Aspergillus sclerotialis TaxID=2070753 RepID=A0A3A2ZSM3_9EURO|nr:SH3 domain-containing protein [Aspergillus sclerotialis]